MTTNFKSLLYEYNSFFFQKDVIKICFWYLHLHQMSLTEFVCLLFEIFWTFLNLFEPFGMGQENLNLELS